MPSWLHRALRPNISARCCRGGRRAGKGRPQQELRDIKERIAALADAVENGQMKTGVGSVVNQILNTHLRALQIELQMTEQLELIERLEQVEQDLANKGRWGA